MQNSIYDISANRIDGTATRLGGFAGKVLLIVNVASECGLTPQYEALEKLYEAHRDEGLEVLGFPSNDFGAQEPGSNEEIATFCSARFGVQFPMFEKISVKGEPIHPLYAMLIGTQPEARATNGAGFQQKLADHGLAPQQPQDVSWNFEKFLIARDGRVVARFAPDVTPSDPTLLEALKTELAKPA